jgi:tRNA U34 2-thiouridine synthase MnmA/TrmU
MKGTQKKKTMDAKILIGIKLAMIEWLVFLVNLSPCSMQSPQFDDPQPAITPGQACVVCQSGGVVGGGWILTAG